MSYKNLKSNDNYISKVKCFFSLNGIKREREKNKQTTAITETLTRDIKPKIVGN